MTELTIPDALVADLQELFLSDPPEDVDLPEERIRFVHASGEPPCPRLVIKAGEPKPQNRMDGTALVPVSLEYVTSSHAVTAEAHRLVSGRIDTWWRSIRGSKRRNVIGSRVYLHDQVTRQPVTELDEGQSERITTIRGDLMVTLCEP